ncbi:hypothetical protein Taro_014727 [Colocasia esculenta]|uniref:Disease resistance RPP13-like protein 1 n=1 Tax=Colocasia esculenta TaxID=4460 RepID=A0A843UIY1_COLES|nr:hypothetical protein [Colocasia esculenta]
MEETIRSAIAQAVEESAAAHIGTLTPAASPVPTCRDRISRIHVKARWLIRMLAWVRATLDDAEDMDITDESIRSWLRQLQEVADAAEDLLDEFPHEVLRLGFVGDGGWTAGSITELPRERKMTSEMDRLRDQRMEDIVSRFMKIKKPEQARKPDYRKEQMNAENISARRTSSVIEQPHIVGRDEELANIRQFLLSSDAEDARGSDDVDDHVSVMAIVGMGGLGKTTLAQLAYNDNQVNQHFQLKSWVCVSEDFDVIRLTKAMLQSLNVEASGFSELDPLQRKLVQKLKGQGRLLLVLDDVWEADNLNVHGWNLLTAPLRNRSAGTNIIMTTRSRKVPEMAPRTSTYDLGFLSDEDTLELFMLHAFEGRDPSLYQNLVAVGVNIAKKCKGVPLAAKTLGGLLRTTGDEKWNEILESEVWDATINQEGSITPILRLSYQHLLAPLKRCFRYCSLFPKDYVFDRNRMICMWMAQGFIKANRRKLMEDIGQRYIDSLLSRSFFQTCPSSPKRFLMHDLMHDLARCVSVDECHSMAGSKSSLIPSDIRHLSIILTSDSRGTIIPSIKDIPEPNFFRSFLLPGENFYLSIFERELQSDSYTRMEHLRVLDLGGVGPHRLPESIAHLKHLRYLRISNLIGELPEFVGSMHHLQTLDLEGPYQLPNSMSNLHNLRHIKLGSDVIEYPVGIGKLTDLQTLPGFRVSPKHNCAKLGELKDMNNIRGKFAIKGLENLDSVNEAKKACLDKKRNILYLRLERDHKSDSLPIDEEVLESLKPSVKLRSLKISGFKGPSYPYWLGDLSFSRLHTIKLEHCGNWASLPPLGQLPSLKSLYISEAGAVKYIGNDFFSGGFLQLEELTLEDMYNWKSWCGAQEGDCPKLKNLSISRCENLESLSLINVGAIEVLSISECPELRFLPGDSLELSHLQRVRTITIKGIYQVGCIDTSHFSMAAPLEDQPRLYLEDVGQREAEYVLGMCSSICRLTVRRCWNLTSLPLGNLSALEYVEIIECPQLWITSVYPQLQQLPSVKLEALFLLNEFSHIIHRLAITRCANLTSLPLMELTALKYLEISECNQLQLSSGSLQLPQSSSMLEMKIESIRGAEYVHSLLQCSKCEILPPLGQLCSLKELYVKEASSLESFMQDYGDMSEKVWPETQTHVAFPKLKKLEFHDMPVWKEWLGAREGDFPRLCKLILKHCPKLRALPHLPPSLEKLELEACDELTSLSTFDSNHTQSLKFLKSLRRLLAEGGLGMPDLYVLNTALILKSIYMLGQNADSQWSMLVKDKYCRRGSIDKMLKTDIKCLACEEHVSPIAAWCTCILRYEVGCVGYK